MLPVLPYFRAPDADVALSLSVVEYETASDAQAAIAALQDTDLLGRTISVREFHEHDDGTGNSSARGNGFTKSFNRGARGGMNGAGRGGPNCKVRDSVINVADGRLRLYRFMGAS